MADISGTRSRLMANPIAAAVWRWTPSSPTTRTGLPGTKRRKKKVQRWNNKKYIKPPLTTSIQCSYFNATWSTADFTFVYKIDSPDTPGTSYVLCTLFPRGNRNKLFGFSKMPVRRLLAVEMNAAGLSVVCSAGSPSVPCSLQQQQSVLAAA